MTTFISPTPRSEPLPSTSTPSAARWPLAIAAFTLLAAILRVVAINHHSFWYDEAVTAELIRSSYSDLFRGIARDNGNPPLYWLLAKAWADLFDYSEVALRSFPALCGILSVPLMAILGRRLLGPTAGLLAALLLAISPLAIELSNEARAYALQELLIIGSTLLLLRWLDGRSTVDWLLYSISIVLACLTHYYTFVLPIAHGVALVAGGASSRAASLTSTSPHSSDLKPSLTKSFLWAWLAAMLLAALLWLPWLPSFVAQLHQPGNLARGGQHWHLQFFATPVIFSLGRTFAWRDASRVMLALALAISLLAFWLPALWALFQLRRRPFPVAILAVLFLLPILGPLLVALTLTPLYHSRAASVAMPAFLLLVAFGLVLAKPLVRTLLITIIICFTAASLFGYVTRPLKDDWRSAVPALLANLHPAEPLLFDTAIEVTSSKYYLAKAGSMPAEMIGLTAAPTESTGPFGVRYLNGNRIDSEVISCADHIRSASSLWLILCVPQGSFTQYHSFFSQHGFVLDKSHHFHRIDLYRFTKHLSPPQP